MVLGTLFAIFNFLQYGTTAQVGRASGVEPSGSPGSSAARRSARLGVGIALTLLLVALAPSVVELMGGDGRTADYAVTYLRIVSLGFPRVHRDRRPGYLRGVADLRTRS